MTVPHATTRGGSARLLAALLAGLGAAPAAAQTGAPASLLSPAPAAPMPATPMPATPMPAAPMPAAPRAAAEPDEAAGVRQMTREQWVRGAERRFDRLSEGTDSLERAKAEARIDDMLRRVKARAMARFDEGDADRDGKLTRDEARVAGRRAFDALDRDGDGRLSRREMGAFRRSMREENRDRP